MNFAIHFIFIYFRLLTDAGYGVTYIRWGRKDCPAGADVVYSGKSYISSYLFFKTHFAFQ